MPKYLVKHLFSEDFSLFNGNQLIIETKKICKYYKTKFFESLKNLFLEKQIYYIIIRSKDSTW